MNTVTVVITGLSMGLTVLVGRKIGEGAKEEAGEIIGTGIWMFGLLAIVLSVVMVFAARFMTGLIGAFGVRIPVSYIMSQQAVVSVFHVGLATPASTVVQIILCGVYFVVLLKRQQKK